MTVIGLSILCGYMFRSSVRDNDWEVAGFFFTGMIFMSLNLVKDLLDMCWMRSVISEHVYELDLENYLHDEGKIQSIKEDIMLTRKIQIMHAVNVDVKDERLSVLFDEQFSEDNVSRFIKFKEREARQHRASAQAAVSSEPASETLLP